MICPEMFMHFGFLHSFWTLVCLGLYRSLFLDWACFGILPLSFSFFINAGFINFVTTSAVRVVMDIFINQNASKLFLDFLLCVLLKSGAWGFFVLARVCSYCAGVNIFFCAITLAHAIRTH